MALELIFEELGMLGPHQLVALDLVTYTLAITSCGQASLGPKWSRAFWYPGMDGADMGLKKKATGVMEHLMRHQNKTTNTRKMTGHQFANGSQKNLFFPPNKNQPTFLKQKPSKEQNKEIRENMQLARCQENLGHGTLLISRPTSS